MKVGFYRTINEKDPRDYAFGSLGAAYLSSYLKKFGGYEEFYLEQNIKTLIDKKPDLIGISAYSQTYDDAIKCAKRLKSKLDIPVILGGHHISALPESLDPIFDAAVIGEGEEPFLHLTNLFKKNRFSHKYLSEVNGLAFHKDGEVKITPSNVTTNNLDDIPPPDLDIFDNLFHKDFSYHLHTSRGCPYKCVFCVEGGTLSRVRYHSPERVIVDIENILRVKEKHSSGQSIIYITDDIFAINIRRIEKIVRLIKENKLEKHFWFVCHARADIFNKQMAQLLKEMNVNHLMFGLESGSDIVLKNLKSTTSNSKKNQKALDIAKEFGFCVSSYFLLGSPAETPKELAKTYWFIFRNRYLLNSLQVSKLTPLPGTPIWDDYVKNNLILKDGFKNFDWSLLHLTNRTINFPLLNKNYSEGFYSYSFKIIDNLKDTIRTRGAGQYQPFGYMGLKDIGQNEGQILYEQFMYKKYISSLIPKEVNSILEISQKKNQYFNFTDKYTITSIKPNEYPNKENIYDLALFSHSLEQLIDIEFYIKKIFKSVKKDGYFIFLIYNTSFIEFLLDLIYDNLNYKVYGLRQSMNYQYFSLKTINKLLNKLNFKVLDTLAYKIVPKRYEHKSKIIDSLKKYLPVNGDVDIHNYIVLAKRM